MKRATLSLVLSFFAVVAATAQDKFPDVPEQHWAYKEVASPNPAVRLFDKVGDFIADGWSIPAVRYTTLVLGSVCLLAILLNLASSGKSLRRRGKQVEV